MLDAIEVFGKIRRSGLSDYDAICLFMEANAIAIAQRKLELRSHRFEERLADAVEDSYMVQGKTRVL